MKNIFILILLIIAKPVFAQKIPDFGLNKVRISGDTKVVQADLIPVDSDPDIETDLSYYWYSSNVIHNTQGGFSGRLLNGKYVEYYLNKNLKEEGFFNKGLKDGVWKDWDENGILTQLYTWKNGVKKGDFELFFTNGRMKQKGSYHNNLLDGNVKTYDEAGAEIIVNYKNGAVVEKKPEKFWQKLNFFKRQDKTSVPTTKKSLQNK